MRHGKVAETGASQAEATVENIRSLKFFFQRNESSLIFGRYDVTTPKQAAERNVPGLGVIEELDSPSSDESGWLLF